MQSFGNLNDKATANYKFEIIPSGYSDQSAVAVFKASQGLEFYDDEFVLDPSQQGIKSSELISIQDLSAKCTSLYQETKFPIVLGEESELSLVSIKAAYDYLQIQGKQLILLVFAAQANLAKDQILYSIYKACPKIKIILVGIRKISQSECDWLRSLEKQVSEHVLDEMPISIFYARDEFYKSYAYRSALKEFREEVNPKDDSGNKLAPAAVMKFWGSKDVLEMMKKYNHESFYINFDLTAFDSSLMPSVKYPEPGGLDWYTPTNLIRELAKHFNLVGATITGLSPIAGFIGPDLLAAKLIYKIIANVIANQSNSIPEIQD